LFFVCDAQDSAAKAAGRLRNKLGADLGLINENDFAFCWVDNFPFFEPDEERGGAPAFTHNPFSYPMATLEELSTMDESAETVTETAPEESAQEEAQEDALEERGLEPPERLEPPPDLLDPPE
jgi:aspartyl-tRNA synthetase